MLANGFRSPIAKETPDRFDRELICVLDVKAHSVNLSARKRVPCSRGSSTGIM